MQLAVGLRDSSLDFLTSATKVRRLNGEFREREILRKIARKLTPLCCPRRSYQLAQGIEVGPR